jgi:hypothetical protein
MFQEERKTPFLKIGKKFTPLQKTPSSFCIPPPALA